MTDLAEQSGGKPVPLKDVAERQGISKKYLEIIVKDLVKSGLINGASGKGGGYMLCREADDYTIGEILEATEGPFAIVSCLVGDKNVCPRAGVCRTLPIWEEYDRMTRDFFFSKKLSDVLTPRDE